MLLKTEYHAWAHLYPRLLEDFGRYGPIFSAHPRFEAAPYSWPCSIFFQRYNLTVPTMPWSA